MLTALGAVFRSDLLAAYRRRAETVNVAAFFAVAIALFPLGIGPEPRQLQAVAAGVIWVAALLSSLLSLHRLFAADYADGSLEQIVLSSAPLPLLVLGKIGAHWLCSGLPVVLLGPVFCLQFGLTPAEILVLSLSLLIGTPVLSLIGAVGAALTLGLRGGGALLALLVLPLYVPVLVFGAGAVVRVEAGLVPAGELLLLGACLALSLLLAPWACAAALRIAVE